MNILNMKYFLAVTLAMLALLTHRSIAVPTEGASAIKDKRAISPLVSGTPPGFASGTTGGGTATPVYPSTIAQLKTYLTSTSPQVIVISGTYDFSGSEGTVTKAACNAYSCAPAAGGQALLNTLGGCGTTATYNVNIDAAAFNPLWIQSQKTLIGKNGATIKGKGFRLSGVTNIIIQNIAITNLNPAYVWGGDAFALTGTTNVWIDHTSSLGRQHYSFGTGSSSGITISNSFINGKTSYSATCDQHTYWGLELVGSNDQITFYKNYVYYTSGRAPALSGNTLFHAVNNVFSSASGHMIEGTDNGMGVYEGNYFVNCPVIVGTPLPNVRLFTSLAADVSKCGSYLGRNCVSNSLSNSGAFSFSNTDILTLFQGKTNIVAAASASSIQSSVVTTAGNTL